VVDLERVLELLGRHVVRRAHHLVRTGQPSAVGGAAEDLGQPEVGDLHPALGVDEDVLGLDVTMHDTRLVRELQRVADVRDHFQRLARLDLAAANQPVQIGTVDVFHQQVVALARTAEVVDRDDRRMAQTGQRAGLAAEALGEVGAGGGGHIEQLERDHPVERFLAGLVDHAHATLSEQLENLELGKIGRDLGGLGGRAGRDAGCGLGRGPGLGLLQTHLQQALGAGFGSRFGWERGAAAGALFRGRHG